MATKHKRVQKTYSVLSGTITGVLVSVLISLLCAGALAMLAVNGRISEGSTKYWVIMTQVLAALAGVAFAGKLVPEKKILAGAAACGGYCAVLLGTTLLFFDGQFGSLWTGLITLLISGALAILLCNRQGRKHGRPAGRYKRHNR